MIKIFFALLAFTNATISFFVARYAIKVLKEETITAARALFFLRLTMVCASVSLMLSVLAFLV